MPEESEELAGQAGNMDLAEQSMSILSSLHAAMINFHLYPPTSDIVEDSVRRALEELEEALSVWGSITFCELEGKLLINEFSLDERDQSRPNTVSFLKDLSLWEVRSITFDQGLSDKDLRIFLEIFSRKRSDRTLENSLSNLLEEGGAEYVKVDEKIYVSLSKDQEVTTGADMGHGGGAMDMLRDEVFVRFLVGNTPNVDASPEEVSELMSDPERINSTFTSIMLGFEGSGGSVGPEKARLIRDTVDRMYSMVDRLADEELKNTLSDELVGILAALEPETLVEVLSEATPQAVRDEKIRKNIISSVDGENVLKLADQVIEKYQSLLEARESMDPQDFHDISSVLDAVIADLYTESDPAFHLELTKRLRESGLLEKMATNHPQAGKEMETYTIITEIRTSDSLRALEGLGDEDVIAVAGKLLDMGDKDIARKIITVTSRNLSSDRPDFRARACRFLKEMHIDFKERGHRTEIMERIDDLLAMLETEDDPEVREGLVQLIGCIANDLFVEDRVDAFGRACEALVALADGEGDERLAGPATTALSSLNPWDVGRPLADSLYEDDEKMAELASMVLPYIEESMTVKEIIGRLKGEEEIKITPQLADVCGAIGDPLYNGLKELMESNAREEVYLRTLQLLELMGGNHSLSLVKTVEGNPIPMVRVHAVRSMAKISPGDPSLLSHFMQALKDEDPEVRREAVRGLGTIDDRSSVDTLLMIVQGKGSGGAEEHPRVEEAACFALARLGPEKALPAISDLLRKKVFSLRKRVVHSRVKAAACYALGQIGGPEEVELIRSYLEDSDPIVRNEARKAVGELRKKGYVS